MLKLENIKQSQGELENIGSRIDMQTLAVNSSTRH